MLTLPLSNIYERGLTAFQSLSPLERDVFSVHDANLRFEMEGTLSAFLGGSACAPVVTWLSDTLRRVGDEESRRLLSEMATAYGKSSDDLDKLSAQFYSRMDQRWKLVDEYLESRGARVVA